MWSCGKWCAQKLSLDFLIRRQSVSAAPNDLLWKFNALKALCECVTVFRTSMHLIRVSRIELIYCRYLQSRRREYHVSSEENGKLISFHLYQNVLSQDLKFERGIVARMPGRRIRKSPKTRKTPSKGTWIWNEYFWARPDSTHQKEWDLFSWENAGVDSTFHTEFFWVLTIR